MFGLEREKKFDTTLAVWWFIWLGFKLVLGKPLRLSSLFTASRGESNLKKRRRQEEEEARGSRGVEEFGGKDVEPIIDLAACHRLVLLLAAFLPTNSSRQRHYSKTEETKGLRALLYCISIWIYL